MQSSARLAIIRTASTTSALARSQALQAPALRCGLATQTEAQAVKPTPSFWFRKGDRLDVPTEVYPLLFIVGAATTGCLTFMYRHTYLKIKNEAPLRWWPENKVDVEREKMVW